MKKSSILVTGVSGFIGAALTKKLLERGENVIGIDNMNSYYEKSLKYSRLNQIIELTKEKNYNFEFIENSIENINCFEKYLRDKNIEIIFHLAAQAGVRYSLENPNAYFQSNLLGFGNVLELARKLEVSNFLFASSSSVYGGNKELPFREDHSVDKPLSLYAATKKSNELMAYSYSHLYRIPTTGLRFFTVYGPFGRPDMAPIIFLRSIMNGTSLKIFNKGNMRRDFTYIDDIIEGLIRCCYKPVISDNSTEDASNNVPFKIFNIGSGKPIELMKFISLLEDRLGLEAKKQFLPMQQGDVVETFASTEALKKWIKFSPSTSIENGIDKLVHWYKEYYRI